MTFKDNLLDDLMREHGPTVTAPETKRSKRPLLVAAAALVIAGGGTVVLTNSSPEAWAVTRNTDGSVTVSIPDIKAIAPANAKLREYGVRAKAVAITDDCPGPVESKALRGVRVRAGDADDRTLTLWLDDVQEGQTVLLGVTEVGTLGIDRFLVTGPVADPAPDCLRKWRP